MDAAENTLQDFDVFLHKHKWRHFFSGSEWDELKHLTQQSKFQCIEHQAFWSRLLLSWDTRQEESFRSLYTELASSLKEYIRLTCQYQNWPRQEMDVLLFKLSEIQIEQQQKQLLFWRFEHEKKQARIQLAEIDNETAQAESYNLLKLNLAFSDVPQEKAEIIDVALDCLMGLLDTNFSALFLYDEGTPGKGNIYTQYNHEANKRQVTPYKMPSEGFFSQFLRQDRLWAEKFFVTPENQHLFSDIITLCDTTQSFLVCQLNIDQQIAGFVIVAHKESDGLDGFKRFFNMLSINIANAIQNIQLNAQINEMAIRDAITGLFNRHHIEERLSHCFAVSRRYNRELSLVLIDIDHFKNINDTKGHQTGDIVLKKIAQTMQSRLRSTDILGRYGGEEFLIILQETGLDGALTVAQNLVNIVKETPIDIDGYTPLNITISAGYATYPNNSKQMDALIKLADEGMYLAKNKGRNQVGHTAQDASVIQ